jgi:hypothetical protein
VLAIERWRELAYAKSIARGVIEASWLVIIKILAFADCTSTQVDHVLYSHWPTAIDFVVANERRWIRQFTSNRAKSSSTRQLLSLLRL